MEKEIELITESRILLIDLYGIIKEDYPGYKYDRVDILIKELETYLNIK